MCYMKLGRYREKSKLVARCDRSALLGFTNLPVAAIAGMKKRV